MIEKLYLLFKLIPLTVTALFPVINPIGCSVMFLSLTPDADHKLRKQVAKKIAVYTFVVLVTILFIGVYILQLFGISIPIIEVCGGLVMAVMGWNMLAQEEESHDKQENTTRNSLNLEEMYINQAFYPFTFPFTVGPGVIAVMLTVSAHLPNEPFPYSFLEYGGAIIGIIIMATMVYFGYGYAEKLVSLLKESMQVVIMRILSFILLCIGTQILWTGLLDLYQLLPAK